MQEYDRLRREALARLLAGGSLALAPAGMVQAFWFFSKPKKLADDRSIYSLDGEVFVNDRLAEETTRIRAGDRVRTGARGNVIFVVGGDSFLLRNNASMEIDGAGFVVRGLRLLSGAMLSVFAQRDQLNPVAMHTTTATIGVRGTGVYVEAEPDLAYVCTCYGRVRLAAVADPGEAEDIETRNHDMPRYISATPRNGSRINPAPIINHTNAELKLLEAVVGRSTPPGFGRGSYNR